MYRLYLQTDVGYYSFPDWLINSSSSADIMLICLPEEGWAPVAINWNCVSAYVYATKLPVYKAARETYDLG